MGLSERASLPALGTLCGSGIPIGELVTQEELQEQFAKYATHTGHLRTANPIPTHWQAESVGSQKRMGSWRKWLQKCGLYPTGSLQGPPGHTQGSREKATLGPAEGEGRRQRAMQGAGWAKKRQMESLNRGVSLHTHHHAHFVLKQLCQPSAKQSQPPTPPTRRSPG